MSNTTIEAAIRAGTTTVEVVSERCGAATECGRCCHMIHSDLERGAVGQLETSIVTCDGGGDVGSSQLLRSMVAGEDVQLDWLTTQLELEQLGAANYLAQQLDE